MYSDISMRTIACSSSNKKLGQRPRRLGFAHARRSQKHERPDRPLGILQPRARTPNRIRHALQAPRPVRPRAPAGGLPSDQLLHFAFEHLRNRNAGPLGDDVGDVLLVHFFLQHARGLLCRPSCARRLASAPLPACAQSAIPDLALRAASSPCALRPALFNLAAARSVPSAHGSG